MKPEPKIKKLTLNKETLRDLTADHAADVKGGGRATRTCTSSLECTLGGCPTFMCPTVFCKGKTANCVTRKQWGC